MALDDRAHRWAIEYLPAVMPLLKTAMYRRGDGNTAVQVDVNGLFSFDLVFVRKTWWFVTSERAPHSRYRPPKELHRTPGRVALNVAQIAFWCGWEVLDEDLVAADELRYLPDMEFTAYERFKSDAVARSAYEFVYRVATDQIQPNLMPGEQYIAKQMVEMFDSQLGSVGLTAHSWSLRELGSPR